jgi:Asp-tRNA(Asn)/Glu-tRNA(Gln) amidotransferase C subunit
MSDLDARLVRLATLSKLNLPEDTASLKAELGALLGHLTTLAALDTSGLAPFTHALDAHLAERVTPCESLTPEVIAALAPDARVRGEQTFVAVPPMHASHGEHS